MGASIGQGNPAVASLAVMQESPSISPVTATQPSPRVIEMVAFDAVQLLDVTGPLQVFATANEIIAGWGGAAPYLIRIVAREAPGVTASAGIGLTTQVLPPPATAIDTLIVAGGPGVTAATRDTELLAWLTRRVAAARRSASVCTGAYLLERDDLSPNR
jgi:transcriptional regulator GlxA family with amidase domain